MIYLDVDINNYNVKLRNATGEVSSECTIVAIEDEGVKFQNVKGNYRLIGTPEAVSNIKDFVNNVGINVRDEYLNVLKRMSMLRDLHTPDVLLGVEIEDDTTFDAGYRRAIADTIKLMHMSPVLCGRNHSVR